MRVPSFVYQNIRVETKKIIIHYMVGLMGWDGSPCICGEGASPLGNVGQGVESGEGVPDRKWVE